MPLSAPSQEPCSRACVTSTTNRSRFTETTREPMRPSSNHAASPARKHVKTSSSVQGTEAGATGSPSAS